MQEPVNQVIFSFETHYIVQYSNQKTKQRSASQYVRILYFKIILISLKNNQYSLNIKSSLLVDCDAEHLNSNTKAQNH